MAGDIEGGNFKRTKSDRRRRRRLEILRSRSVDIVELDSGSFSTPSSSLLPSDGDVPCLSHGSASVCGRRREMEDAVAVRPALIGESQPAAEVYDFFGVYDGHGGDMVARACRERLHVALATEVEKRRWCSSAAVAAEEEEGWREAIGACFAKVDEEVLLIGTTEEAAEGRTVGSTAVVAVVGARRIVVGNCGDSRAVLSRGGAAVPLSRDHKPNRPDELERVEAAGGRVINWDGHRILGVLATSRSIGDHYFKPYVTCEPEVTVTDRTIHDEFLILASDGLWDVVSNEVACVVARRCLTRHPALSKGVAASEAATVLVELAMARGSGDNISVVVVELKRITRRRRLTH
ncbi:putative protein phosphatase 2C 8 [Acorus calamus]|uniref:protein-serine/threonine phosphatase n=1 Tax=Acorus calamus TaxID=4465 RepID=A0AAV9DLH3_ACOCL|nr:putative protein phosphatase 2C 8 [Acorus calamus]KAK1302335.1 putative protein phosphatase 2C 8 [Acorus calamus]